VRLATGLVGPDDAADVVSSAVASCSVSPAWRGARDQRAYLFRSFVNEARMHHRAGRRRRARELRAAPGERAEDPRDVEALAYMSVLSVRQAGRGRAHVLARPRPGRRGAMLGISRSTVARHLGRAHTRLREVMGHD